MTDNTVKGWYGSFLQCTRRYQVAFEITRRQLHGSAAWIRPCSFRWFLI